MVLVFFEDEYGLFFCWCDVFDEVDFVDVFLDVKCCFVSFVVGEFGVVVEVGGGVFEGCVVEGEEVFDVLVFDCLGWCVDVD